MSISDELLLEEEGLELANDDEEITKEIEGELGLLWHEDTTKPPGELCTACKGRLCKGTASVYLLIGDSEGGSMVLGSKCQLMLLGKLLRMWVRSVTGRKVSMRPLTGIIPRPEGA